MSWKQDIFVKYSPVLGIEKTNELISSIEKVYFDPQGNEDAINIIDYLIEIINSNLDNYDSLVNEYHKFKKKYMDTEVLLLLYRVVFFIYVVLIVYYKNQINNPVHYLLISFFNIPIIYEIYKKLKK
jgi:hypothetical protein